MVRRACVSWRSTTIGDRQDEEERTIVLMVVGSVGEATDEARRRFEGGGEGF